MDGLHTEGMTEDKRDTVFSTEVSKLMYRKHTFGSQDDLSAVGGDGLQKRFRGGLHVPVNSVSPAWSRMHTYVVRAWRSMPQEKGCCLV